MRKIHLIGNAHLDPVWLWRWQEGFSEILATFKSALDRMNDFPDFKFTSACASYYEWIEKIDPDMFEEIKKRFNVMSVPCLVIGDEKISFGKKNIHQILDLLA